LAAQKFWQVPKVIFEAVKSLETSKNDFWSRKNFGKLQKSFLDA